MQHDNAEVNRCQPTANVNMFILQHNSTLTAILAHVTPQIQTCTTNLILITQYVAVSDINIDDYTL